MSRSSVRLQRVVQCASSPEALWPLLADTDRLNRAAGLARIEVKPLDGAGAARFLVSTKLGGFRVEYEERPVEFVEGERFKFVRVLRRGPVRSIQMSFELRARADGTEVVLSLEIAPRWPLIGVVARFNGKRTLAALAGELRRIDGAAAGGALEPPSLSVPANAGAFGRAALVLVEAVPAHRRALAHKLVEHVRTAPDAAVARIRPFELADAWSAPRRDVLAVCLQAVIAGLLELSWDLVCPSCRTAAERTPSLANLGQEGHCQLCDLSFGLDLDKAVEATFRPPTPVRAIDDGPYCIGGPARMPHVVVQSVLPARSTAVLPVPRRTGRFRLFVRGGAIASVEVRPDAAATTQAEAGERLSPGALAVAPGGGIEVRSTSAEDSHVKLERLEWIERAATAAFVSALPEFRRLFSGEVLAPGLALKVGRVTLLFTDLSSSTALYGRAGDAPAFRLVRDSFDLVRTAVEAQGGTVVKTIGDAVMAAFTAEEDALRAAVAMQRAFPEFIRRYHYADGVDLKLGVYSGPCFAVTANGVLDYFGQTVNVAARLQAEAGPGELVVPDALAEAASAAGWLAGARVTARFDATLKGVGTPLRVARVRATGPATAAVA